MRAPRLLFSADGLFTAKALFTPPTTTRVVLVVAPPGLAPCRRSDANHHQRVLAAAAAVAVLCRRSPACRRRLSSKPDDHATLRRRPLHRHSDARQTAAARAAASRAPGRISKLEGGEARGAAGHRRRRRGVAVVDAAVAGQTVEYASSRASTWRRATPTPLPDLAEWAHVDDWVAVLVKPAGGGGAGRRHRRGQQQPALAGGRRGAPLPAERPDAPRTRSSYRLDWGTGGLSCTRGRRRRARGWRRRPRRRARCERRTSRWSPAGSTATASSTSR